MCWNLHWWYFTCVDIYKSKMDKTTGDLAQINAIAPNCTCNPYILYCQEFTIKQMPVSCKNVLMKQQKLLILLNLSHWVCLFFLFCVTNLEACIRHLCCIPKYDNCLKEKRVCDWAASSTSCFFSQNAHSLERSTDKLWLFRLGFLVSIFLKIIKIGVPL